MAPDFLGTLPQWLTLGGVSGIIGIVLRYRLGSQKLSNADEADIRDHYAQEVAAMREKLDRQETHFQLLEKHLREMIAASDQRAEESDRRHAECEAARQAMRREIDGMHDEIRGLKRQIPEVSADKLLILEGKPSEVAPHSTAAAKRIKENGDGK